MPWVVELPSGRYRAGYRAADGKTRYVRGTFDYKKAAERAAGAAEHDARRPGWSRPEDGLRPWGQWVDDWWGRRTVSESTLRREKSMLELHLRPVWGSVPLADITRLEVKAWIGELNRTMAPSSADRVAAVFKASLEAAMDAGALRFNPAFRIRVTAPQVDRRRYLTREEASAILEALPSARDQAIFATLLYTGMRWGEMVGLRIERIRGDRTMLRVAEVMDVMAGQMKDAPKSGKFRDVPIPKTLRPHIESTIQDRSSGFLFLPQPHISNWRQRVWMPALHEAGVAHTRIHDIRHTYASWLIQAGVSIAEVGKLLGHSDSKTTELYAHLAEVASPAVISALDGV